MKMIYIVELLKIVLKCLKKFINSGPKPNNTIFTYESRGLTIEQIMEDCDLIRSSIDS